LRRGPLRNHLPEIAVVTVFACLLLASCAALPPYRSLAFSVISGTLASACESAPKRKVRSSPRHPLLDQKESELSALGLTTTAIETLADARAGKNGRPALVGWLRQSVSGRLAGYEDINNAERIATIRRRADSRRQFGSHLENIA
jgi:hypothetical protein